MRDQPDSERNVIDRRRVLRATGAVALGTAGLAGGAQATGKNADQGPKTFIQFCGCSAYCLCTTNNEGKPLMDSEATLYTAHDTDEGGFEIRKRKITNGCDEPGGKVVIICVHGNYYCNTHPCATNTGALAAARDFAKDGEGSVECDNGDTNAVIQQTGEGGCGEGVQFEPCRVDQTNREGRLGANHDGPAQSHTDGRRSD